MELNKFGKKIFRKMKNKRIIKGDVITRFSRWWKRQVYPKNGFYIGALIGFLKIPFFIFLGESIPDAIHFLFSRIPDETICNILNIKLGESCGFFILFYGFIYNPIFYGLIGWIIGSLYLRLKNKMGFLLLVYFIIIFFFILPVNSFEVIPPANVHQYLTNESQEIWSLIPYEIKQHLTNPINRTTNDNDYNNGDDIIDGSREEDLPLLSFRYLNHFWEPDNPKNGNYDDGISVFTSSYDRAKQFWLENVIKNYLKGDIDEAYYWLGRIAHLLEDTAQPSHVHLDAHPPWDESILENWTNSNWGLYDGLNYQDQEYNYENLIDNFNWSRVDPVISPLDRYNLELFRLFWFTAQKTQYWASDDVDGNIIYVNLSDGEQNWQCDGSGNLNLWVEEGYTSCSDFINSSSDLNETTVEKEANATIPHAMKSVAGLYKLFWDAVNIEWPTFQHDNRRTGYSLIKGDINSVTKKPVWNSSGDNSTDFWDGPVIADIDGNIDEGMELIVGTENYEGTDGRVYALDGKTNNLLWSFNNTAAVHTPSINDIDGDGKKEAVVIDRNAVTWVINTENGSEQWHYSLGSNEGYGSAVADLDNLNGREIIFSEFNESILVDGQNYTPKQVKFYALNNTGGIKWSSDWIDNGATSDPAVADLDSDGYPEIVVTTFFKVYVFNGEDGSTKWEIPLNEMHSSPTIADIDGDNEYEIIIGTINPIYYDCWEFYSECYNSIYVLDSLGNVKWNRTVDYGVLVSPAVANLDNDNNLEVVVATNDGPDFHNNPNKSIGKGTLYVFDGITGNQEWNYIVGGKVDNSPSIIDIDSDRGLEIIFGAYNGFVYIVNETGDLEWKHNVSSYIFGNPAIGDLDGDGVAEIAVKHAHGIGEKADKRFGGRHREPKMRDIKEKFEYKEINSTNGSIFSLTEEGESSGEPSLLEILGGTNNQPILNNLTNITANQTALININATGQIWATDQDNDTLTYYYSYPFNSSGYWQTTRGNDSGNYSVLVEVSDGNLSDYQIINVEVIDNLPPIVYVISPIDQVYNTTIIDFNISIDERGSWCGFSLDVGINVSMTKSDDIYFNYTKSNLTDGQHSIKFSCNDTFGNMNTTGTFSFFVDIENITVCRKLTRTNLQYQLLNNVSSSGTCINITANNISLDGQGHTILYAQSSDGKGIYNKGYNQTTIKNLSLFLNRSGITGAKNSHAISFVEGRYHNITNVNILIKGQTTSTGSCHGIYLDDVSDSVINKVIANTSNTYFSHGIYIYADDANRRNNKIFNSETYAYASNSMGIRLYGVNNGGIRDLFLENLSIYSKQSYGIDFESGIFGTGETEMTNIFITSEGSSTYGIYLEGDGEDILINNSNISSLNSYDIKSNNGNHVVLNVTYIDEEVTSGTLTRKWYLNVKVNETNGSNINQANVTGWNVSQALAFSKLTNSNGDIETQELIEYINNAGTKTYYTNYTINVTKQGYYNNSKSVNLTNNLNLVFTLESSILPNDTSKFYIKNSVGNVVAWLGTQGNAVIEGSKFEGGCSTFSPGDGSFIFKNSSLITNAFLNSSGDLCVKNFIEENETCNTNKDAFRIKNSSYNTMLYIDVSGSMCLKGKLYENQDL